jgi:hypothetical protein
MGSAVYWRAATVTIQILDLAGDAPGNLLHPLRFAGFGSKYPAKSVR